MTQLEDGRDVVMLLVGDATARRHAEQARDVLSDQVAMIGRVSEALVGTEDAESALRRIADQVVPTLGDWVSMQLYDERGETRNVVTRHSDPDLAELCALVRGDLAGIISPESPSRRLARGEPPILLPRVEEEMLARFVPDPSMRATLRALGSDSLIAVPLEGREARIGSMVLTNGASSLPFGEQELAIAVEVGRRVGIALETLHLYSQQRALAEELQRSMLTAPPSPAHAEIAVRYLPAANEAQVGGDWYDAYLQADGSIVLSIGDVVGHDYRAAAAMGQLRGMLRGIGYSRGGGPGDMLRALDAAIEGLLPGTTATAVVARISASTTGDFSGPRLLLWSNAGHPPPLLVPHGCDPVVLAVPESDLILGVVPDAHRRETEAEILPGDTLLLYSDGLIERRDRDLDEGLAELRQALSDSADLPLEGLCDHLIDRLVLPAHDDDVALVALRLRPPTT
jgi:serine phosphatase RsbU (regulator of sigma subunit)